MGDSVEKYFFFLPPKALVSIHYYHSNKAARNKLYIDLW